MFIVSGRMLLTRLVVVSHQVTAFVERDSIHQMVSRGTDWLKGDIAVLTPPDLERDIFRIPGESAFNAKNYVRLEVARFV